MRAKKAWREEAAERMEIRGGATDGRLLTARVSRPLNALTVKTQITLGAREALKIETLKNLES